MQNKQITKNNLNKIKDLLSDIKNMSNEDFKAMLNKTAQFHEYSLFNQILLFYSGASQVAGFHKWKSLKRSIKKGSKAIWILAPSGTFIKKREVTNKDTGNKEIKEDVIQYFKSVPVFDISCTEGEPIKNGLTTEANIDINKIKDFTLKEGLQIDYKPMEIKQGGYIYKKVIVLNSNLSETENTGTLIHELSHYFLGHTAEADINSRDIKEQEAETTTYLLCSVLGINRNSTFYLKCWDADYSIIKSSFKKINKAFKTILEGITKKEDV